MRLCRAAGCGLALLAGLLAAGASNAQKMGLDDRAAVSGENVWVLLPPELVAEADVRQATWSPNGAYVIATRTAMRLSPQAMRDAVSGRSDRPPAVEGRNAIVLWSRRTGVGQEVWKQPIQGSNMEEAAWLSGASVALAVVTYQPQSVGAPQQPAMRRAVLRIDGPGGTVRSLGELPAGDPFWVSVSPVSPVALIWRASLEESAAAGPPGTPARAIQLAGESLTLVRASGPTAPVQLPPGKLAGRAAWTSDGHAFIAMLDAAADPGKPPAPRRYLLDPATGRFAPAPEKPALYQPPPAAQGPLTVKQTSAALKEGDTTRTLRPIWLEAKDPGDPPRMLVCAQGDWAKLSPSGDAVLYSSQGAVWVASLVPLPAQLVKVAREAALRATTMSNAKQLGLALMMYSQDFDGTLPSQSDYSNGLISPYVKNDTLFQGFTYTFGGGKMSDIASPAETQLGFSTGPGGRAIIYADGHVVWKDD